jgi:hypothetical protein
MAPIARPTSPVPGEEDVNPAASVRLLLWGDPVEPWSISIDRGGGLALALTFDAGSAIFEAEFNGARSGVSFVDGIYSIVVDLVDDFSLGSEVTVDVNAFDALANPVVIEA